MSRSSMTGRQKSNYFLDCWCRFNNFFRWIMRRVDATYVYISRYNVRIGQNKFNRVSLIYYSFRTLHQILIGCRVSQLLPYILIRLPLYSPDDFFFFLLILGCFCVPSWRAAWHAYYIKTERNMIRNRN